MVFGLKRKCKQNNKAIIIIKNQWSQRARFANFPLVASLFHECYSNATTLIPLLTRNSTIAKDFSKSLSLNVLQTIFSIFLCEPSSQNAYSSSGFFGLYMVSNIFLYHSQINKLKQDY